MQSAKGKTKKWVLDWDTLQGAGRWENPLMGWASSADYMQGTTMAFRSKEDAVAFVRIALTYFHHLLDWWAIGVALTEQAERQGWAYYVQTPHEPKIPSKNYGTSSSQRMVRS